MTVLLCTKDLCEDIAMNKLGDTCIYLENY